MSQSDSAQGARSVRCCKTPIAHPLGATSPLTHLVSAKYYRCWRCMPPSLPLDDRADTQNSLRMLAPLVQVILLLPCLLINADDRLACLQSSTVSIFLPSMVNGKEGELTVVDAGISRRDGCAAGWGRAGGVCGRAAGARAFGRGVMQGLRRDVCHRVLGRWCVNGSSTFLDFVCWRI